jgi:hypothetical protein
MTHRQIRVSVQGFAFLLALVCSLAFWLGPVPDRAVLRVAPTTRRGRRSCTCVACSGPHRVKRGAKLGVESATHWATRVGVGSPAMRYTGGETTGQCPSGWRPSSGYTRSQEPGARIGDVPVFFTQQRTGSGTRVVRGALLLRRRPGDDARRSPRTPRNPGPVVELHVTVESRFCAAVRPPAPSGRPCRRAVRRQAVPQIPIGRRPHQRRAAPPRSRRARSAPPPSGLLALRPPPRVSVQGSPRRSVRAQRR